MNAASLLFWTQLLNLPDYQVVHVHQDTERACYRFTITPQSRLAVCPHCHRLCDFVRQTRTCNRIHDLAIGQLTVELRVRMLQFGCACGRSFTPPLPFLAPASHATERFLQRAADLIRSSDIANAAAFLGVPERTLSNWYHNHLRRRTLPPPAGPQVVRRLGIDEIAAPKRSGYVAVLVDHDNRRVLDVLQDRTKATLIAYLRQQRQAGLLAHVEEVTLDMWDGYVAAVRAVFGDGVVITIDRFHVMKNFQACLTAARRELQRQLPPAERALLKGSRWWWLTNPENLAAADRQRLQQLQRRFPQLAQLAAQRESLRALFEDRTLRNPEQGRRRLQAWREGVERLGLKALARFTTLLGNWLEPIANYFRSRSSQGRVEGLNHGLRALLWRAYGMANFTNFRLRVLHCFGLSYT